MPVSVDLEWSAATTSVTKVRGLQCSICARNQPSSVRRTYQPISVACGTLFAAPRLCALTHGRPSLFSGRFRRRIFGKLKGKKMLSRKEIECLRACNDCAAACLQCASACLNEDQPKPMVHCIALDLECADICRLAAASIAREGAQRDAICTLCAQACQACSTECAKHAMDHCKKCAEACKLCAAVCDAMAE